MTILPPISPEVYGSGRGVEEIAVWNLDGLADAPPPPEKPAIPAWLVVLSAVVPVTLLLAWAAKKARE